MSKVKDHLSASEVVEILYAQQLLITNIALELQAVRHWDPTWFQTTLEPVLNDIDALLKQRSPA